MGPSLSGAHWQPFLKEMTRNVTFTASVSSISNCRCRFATDGHVYRKVFIKQSVDQAFNLRFGSYLVILVVRYVISKLPRESKIFRTFLQHKFVKRTIFLLLS